MSNKIAQRRAALHARKESSFKIGQGINQMVIPQYNALRDPYLFDFFNSASVTKHLKHTGVLPTKKRFAISRYHQLLTEYDRPSSSLVSRQRKFKSESKVHDNNQKLPQVAIEQQKRQLKGSELARGKLYHRSKRHSEQF